MTARLSLEDTTAPSPDRSWIENISQSLPKVSHEPSEAIVVISLLKIPGCVTVVTLPVSNLKVFVHTSSVTTVPVPPLSNCVGVTNFRACSP